jgi:hypothetical protein
MATFIVIPSNQEVSETLAGIVGPKFGKNSYALPSGEWLVAYAGTSRQLFDELGIDKNLIVLNFAGYWGHASQDVWEWIAVYQK